MRIFEVTNPETLLAHSPLAKYDQQQVGHLCENIKQECSQILNIYSSPKVSEFPKYLLRGVGMHRDEAAIYKSHSRINRKPKGTSPLFQQFYDKLLDAKGIKAKRTNSIFCTSDFGQASAFGPVYVIFPVNGFEWSTQKIKDVGSTSTSWIRVKQEMILPFTEVNYQWNYEKSFEINIYNITMFRIAKDLPIIPDQEYEKLIDIPESLRMLDQLYEPTNSNLVEALDSRHEILINGAYYGMSKNLFDQVKNNLLSIPV